MKFLYSTIVILNCLHTLCQIYGYPTRPRPTEYRGAADLDQEDDESPFPIYPFQQYVQVRKTISVEHLPSYAYSSESGDSHQPSASHLASASDQNHHGDHEANHYKIPILREEIDNHKKQEVYEEKGYSDADYDHQSYRGDGHGHGDGDNNNNHDGYHSSATSNHYRPIPRRSLHDSSDGTSTKLLEYAANNLYDSAAHEKGIYQAREDIYCPPVIDFDLNSKDMAMGQGGHRPRGAKPRLRGLGSKISCLKNKYFGREPLDKAIFPDPSESRHSTIQIPTFDDFLSKMKHGIQSDSSFQFKY